MSYPLLLSAVFAVLLATLGSLHDATPDARTPAEILTAARRYGWVRSALAITWGTLMVVLLVLTSILLAVTAHLAAIGGVR
ncbi:hypothetical protein [Microbispora triticiradicis]|uniref:hypothetical protein n=1 Tax=Microbispora triticiradicis TaxID=2200763 RepID=UPI001AD620CF|nr:hypothetical protein [Microbispora triticiradicis]MBO4270413.1 hypothetical protein [Microbispora triticiradicis]